MDKQQQIKIIEELLEGVKELNGEYQEGWESVIEDAEKLINQLKQGSKLRWVEKPNIKDFQYEDGEFKDIVAYVERLEEYNLYLETKLNKLKILLGEEYYR